MQDKVQIIRQIDAVPSMGGNKAHNIVRKVKTGGRLKRIPPMKYVAVLIQHRNPVAQERKKSVPDEEAHSRMIKP